MFFSRSTPTSFFSRVVGPIPITAPPAIPRTSGDPITLFEKPHLDTHNPNFFHSPSPSSISPLSSHYDTTPGDFGLTKSQGHTNTLSSESPPPLAPSGNINSHKNKRLNSESEIEASPSAIVKKGRLVESDRASGLEEVVGDEEELTVEDGAGNIFNGSNIEMESEGVDETSSARAREIDETEELVESDMNNAEGSDEEDSFNMSDLKNKMASYESECIRGGGEYDEEEADSGGGEATYDHNAQLNVWNESVESWSSGGKKG